MGQVWLVMSDGHPVGEITIEDAEFPWLNGRFAPGPGFAAVKHLFDQELALVDDLNTDESVQAWESAYGQVRAAVELVAPGGPVAEFLLHIQDGQAWFRWSDEPFDE
ncbi:hypothetical protein [Longispora urticae]